MWTPASGTAQLVALLGREHALELLTRLLTDDVPGEALRTPPYADVLDHIGNTNAATFFRADKVAVHRYWARAWAARALSHLGDEDAALWLLEALNDSHWRVRMNALQALGHLGAEGHEEELAARLEDEHPRVRRAAALALGRTGNEFALLPLQWALEDDEEVVRRQADRALAKVERRLKDPH